jgi:hypothetical protein
MTITTTHRLVTASWTADVETVETAVSRFRTDHALSNDCHIVLFEIADDGHLHVNVTQKYPTKGAPGWAGPANLPQGFVHNRRFSKAQSSGHIVRHVRDMVFAAPDTSFVDSAPDGRVRPRSTLPPRLTRRV